MRSIAHLRSLAALIALAPFLFDPAVTLEQVPSDDPVPSVPAVVHAPELTPEQLGDSLMTAKRYQAAIEAYKHAPASSASAQNKMGMGYQLMYDLADAARCYQAAIRINPRNASYLNNLGTIYDATKQYSNAERIYRKAIKLDPRNALIRKNLGTAQLAQHKFKQGWETYQAALAIDPQIFADRTSPRVQNPASAEERGAMNYYLAKSCVRAGMIDRAIDYLRAALNEGFTNPKKIAADNEFASLRELPAFQELLAAQEKP